MGLSIRVARLLIYLQWITKGIKLLENFVFSKNMNNCHVNCLVLVVFPYGVFETIPSEI